MSCLIRLALLSLLLTSFSTFGRERIGRLGVGMSNQLINNIPTVSFKLQKSPAYSFGIALGMKTGDEPGGGLGGGLKIYRNLFDEPNLNFYTAGMVALVTKKKSATESDTGYQIDVSLGSEFNFQGIESLGFSFEFGVSINKLDHDLRFETVGDSFLVAAAHFYL